MAAEIELVLVGAETRGVLVDPADRTPALIDQWEEIAFGLEYVAEIDTDEMRTGLDEGFRHISDLRGAAAAPGAAVDEHKNRRIRPLGLPEFDLFDLGRPVG